MSTGSTNEDPRIVEMRIAADMLHENQFYESERILRTLIGLGERYRIDDPGKEVPQR